MENVGNTNQSPANASGKSFVRIQDVILVVIFILGAYFRFTGMNWDQNHHLHPDERFLTMVETGIAPVESLKEYFDTEISKLNPHNAGFGFYVYGTLPIILVRYLAQWLGETGYDQVHLVGRYFSATADLLTVALVYLIALRLYRKEWLAIIAAAFSSFSVLPIQLSHYFTVDTTTNFFAFLAVYFAVRILTSDNIVYNPRVPTPGEIEPTDDGSEIEKSVLKFSLGNWGSLWGFIFFGVALGMAVSSKVSVGLIAVLLPLVVIIRYTQIMPAFRLQWGIVMTRNLIIAAIISLIVFRVCQPYAFSGPGIFGVKLNEKWVNNLKDLSAQSNGDVDFPPALQWARLPFGFAWKNMVVWGLGLPLGILAWGGFLWMAWRILKGDWRQHILIWGWTAFYFFWQSSVFNPTMRYLLPVYPTLAITAAWAVYTLCSESQYRIQIKAFKNSRVGVSGKSVAVIVGIGILICTAVWAFAFTRIYTRPVTRVAASEWIYQNVPSAINIQIDADTGGVTQPLSFQQGETVSAEKPLVMAFTPRVSGQLTDIQFAHIISRGGQSGILNAAFSISEQRSGINPMGQNFLLEYFQPDGNDPRGKEYSIKFEPALLLEADKQYFLQIKLLNPSEELDFAGLITLGLSTESGVLRQSLAEPVNVLRSGTEYLVQFNPVESGVVQRVHFPRIVDWEAQPSEKMIKLSILDPGNVSTPLGVSYLTDKFLATGDPRGNPYTFIFENPVTVQKNQGYVLSISLVSELGVIGIYGSRQAIESTWDDPLPVSLHGYSPFDYVSGLYRSDLNFEMYWGDDEAKRERFINILDQADYIFISSNRQWGTTVRVPERYPMTTFYYRNLLGCPESKDIVLCYRVAETGSYFGKLGFDLVQVFQSDPNIGLLRFNSQFAEEAFTVYDHPKVFIFKKRSDYNPDLIRSMFNGVDLSTAIHITPRKTNSFPGNLMLPDYLFVKQRSGGTWSELFSRQAIPNRYPIVGFLFWYIEISLLGWITYPIVRIAFSGLQDRGYPLIKIFGMVILSFFVWIGASNGLPFNRLIISIFYGILFIINAIFFFWQREEIKQEWIQRRKYYLMIEFAAIFLFVLFLLIRLGNPDLWHPYKGGEKPMDFSYFNAILKSTSFPPFDPWFAGGYINYYYFGFVLVGVMVKWLGIIPSIAYNLVLATLFSFAGMGAFSIGWNLYALSKNRSHVDNDIPPDEKPGIITRKLIYAGSISTIFFLILGNLGTIRMIWQGLIRMASPLPVEELQYFKRWEYSFEGLKNFINGAALPFGRGDWYWIPSRVIPGEPITEFPFFTFLYADLHAHLIALPLTVLALAWILSVIHASSSWLDVKGGLRGWIGYGVTFIVGGIIVGSLRPTNTWDFPTYLILGALAIVYTVIKNITDQTSLFLKIPNRIRTLILPLFFVFSFYIFSTVFYHQFSLWFGQAYNEIGFWEGEHTPIGSYFTHWGLFIFVIISWLFWETREWMANTPLSRLNILRPYKGLIQAFVIIFVILIIVLLYKEIKIGWIVMLLCTWSAILLLRPGVADSKRFVLFLSGTGFFLTLAVELVYLKGDIGRMNTVFKFYLQAWTFLSISASAALIWLFPAVMDKWGSRLRVTWAVVLALLVGGAALFPILGGIDKIRDRINDQAPHTLDGMTYMNYSQYSDFGMDMDLSQDYRAISWMQDNIKGSPVIVEANIPEYRWGTRYTIYTGLPGVVGWNWHQRQQRAITAAPWVTDRVEAIGAFYRTTERMEAKAFLKRYDASYIVVGQLEKAAYPEGIEKFEKYDNDLWQVVYQDLQTSIYQVMR